MRVAFWGLFAIAAALYAAIVGWSLPYITAEAGGRVPFDLRPLGYDAGEARGFLAALSPSGRAFYLGTQHLLDLAYPLALGATLALGFVQLFRGRALWLLLPLAAAVTLFDWSENLWVRRMLGAGPDGPADAIIAAASALTLAKSACTTLAVIALAAGAVARMVKRFRRPV